MARAIIIAMLALAVVVGAGMYYLQVYAYYEEITAQTGDITLAVAQDGAPIVLPVADFRGIDSLSSPLRYRACFRTEAGLAGGGLPVLRAEPRVAPGWFDCFDAARIGADLATGAATAYLSVENLQYGINRVIAVYPDGRAFGWHEINACGEAVFNRYPAPETCPEPPESLR